MDDLRTLDHSLNDSGQEKAWEYDRQKFDRLETAVYNALMTFSCSHSIDGWTVDTHALLHKEHKIRGLQFAELKAGAKNTRGRHSTIFFQPIGSSRLVPGVIRKIFSMPRKQHGVETQAVFIAVHRYKSLIGSDVVDDPFKRCEGFGASLWLEELDSLEIITPSQKMCHATFRKWQESVYVLRPIDRVSYGFVP